MRCSLNRFLATCCVLVSALVGCGGEETPPNVLLVMVDTLRADAFDSETMPHASAWAEQAVVFENAISPSTWTVPSVASLFSGVHPSVHGVRKLRARAEGGVDIDRLAGSHETLAEVLAAAGYQTAALIQSRVISNRGFEQGFVQFAFASEQVQASGNSGEVLTDAALEFVQGRQENPSPFFLYLHYMDPHVPYRAPDPWLGKYSQGISSDADGTITSLDRFRNGQRQPQPVDVDKLWALYREEVSYLDQQLGRLFNALAEHNLEPSTVVVLTGDHGEAFWEHGELFHGGTAYQEKIHVPLVIKAPGETPAVVREWTHGIDVAPTIAGLVGLKAPADWQGVNLFDRGARRRMLVTEVPGLGGAVVDTATGAKLIVDRRARTSLYDLTVDPRESTDESDSQPQVRQQLQQVWQAHLEHSRLLRSGRDSEDAEQPSAEDVEAQKALGYL